MLTELEKRVIAAVQKDIPIIERPYIEIARRLGISEAMLIEILQDLCAKGIIRRFGATIRHQKSGFESNAMVAWQVDEHQVDEVGKKMAEFRQVSHCYLRPPANDWHYNLYTMIHAENEESCRNIARDISIKTGVKTYAILFSRRELKKTSMEYFSIDADN